MAVWENSVKAVLKKWYPDFVATLFERNSPLLKEIKKLRVEGEEQVFPAISGQGAGVGSKLKSLEDRVTTGFDAQSFHVTPGNLFSVYGVDTKQVQASKTQMGAFMRIAGVKMASATQAFRRTLAAAMYGRGYGELCVAGKAVADTSTEFTLNIPLDVELKIDIGSVLDVKASVEATTVKGQIQVNEISEGVITCIGLTNGLAITATDILCIGDSTGATGLPRLPMGLSGWLPTVAKRTGADWTTYIAKPFLQVQRNKMTSRLAGACVVAKANEKKTETIKKLIAKCRRQGMAEAFIVMNDEDWLDVSNEISTTDTYFTQTSTEQGGKKRKATIGWNEMSAGFSTNFVANIWDDPYCPKGRFYVLDTQAVEFWCYTNVETPLQDGIAGNNPGKQDVMDFNDKGQEDSPFKLIVDDFLNVKPGTSSDDGATTLVSLMCYGSFVVKNPSICGVGVFDGAEDVGLLA